MLHPHLGCEDFQQCSPPTVVAATPSSAVSLISSSEPLPKVTIEPPKVPPEPPTTESPCGGKTAGIILLPDHALNLCPF